jgi:hypothetical protein
MKTIMVMAGGTGGHVFGSGRASRLTCAVRRLASTENMAASCPEGGSGE